MLTKQDRKDIRDMIEDHFEEKVIPRFDQLRSDIAQFKDDILGMYKPLTEDHTVLAQHVRNHTDELELHDQRIFNLEKAYSSE